MPHAGTSLLPRRQEVLRELCDGDTDLPATTQVISNNFAQTDAYRLELFAGVEGFAHEPLIDLQPALSVIAKLDLKPPCLGICLFFRLEVDPLTTLAAVVDINYPLQMRSRFTCATPHTDLRHVSLLSE